VLRFMGGSTVVALGNVLPDANVSKSPRAAKISHALRTLQARLSSGNLRLAGRSTDMQDASSDIVRQAAALLTAKGYTREWAEEVLRMDSYATHPDNAEEWVDQILSAEASGGEAAKRREVLDEHHRDGVPPYEPPVRE
jgi:hypothetical protein